MDRCTDGSMRGWVNGWMGQCVVGGIDGECVCGSLRPVLFHHSLGICKSIKLGGWGIKIKQDIPYPSLKMILIIIQCVIE